MDFGEVVVLTLLGLLNPLVLRVIRDQTFKTISARIAVVSLRADPCLYVNASRASFCEPMLAEVGWFEIRPARDDLRPA